MFCLISSRNGGNRETDLELWRTNLREMFHTCPWTACRIILLLHEALHIAHAKHSHCKVNAEDTPCKYVEDLKSVLVAFNAQGVLLKQIYRKDTLFLVNVWLQSKLMLVSGSIKGNFDLQLILQYQAQHNSMRANIDPFLSYSYLINILIRSCFYTVNYVKCLGV